MLRALFAADVTMLHCSTKSALMTLIEKEISTITLSDAPTAAPLMGNKVVIVHGTAELQSIRKPATPTTCTRLADHFTNHPFQMVQRQWRITPGFRQVGRCSFFKVCYQRTKARRSTSCILQNNRSHSHWQSTHNDVLVLALTRYPELCNDVNFITGNGLWHRVIKLKSVVQALGNLMLAALPGLHALSGADITGSFGSKGKARWWKLFKEADEGTLKRECPL